MQQTYITKKKFAPGYTSPNAMHVSKHIANLMNQSLSNPLQMVKLHQHEDEVHQHEDEADKENMDANAGHGKVYAHRNQVKNMNGQSVNKNKVREIPLIDTNVTEAKNRKVVKINNDTSSKVIEQTQRLNLNHLNLEQQNNNQPTRRFPKIKKQSNDNQFQNSHKSCLNSSHQLLSITLRQNEQCVDFLPQTNKILSILENTKYEYLRDIFILYERLKAIYSSTEYSGEEDSQMNSSNVVSDDHHQISDEHVYEVFQYIEDILQQHQHQHRQQSGIQSEKLDVKELKLLEACTQTQSTLLVYNQVLIRQPQYQQYEQKLLQIVQAVYSLRQTMEQLQKSSQIILNSPYSQQQYIQTPQNFVHRKSKSITDSIQKCKQSLEALLSTIKKNKNYQNKHVISSCQVDLDCSELKPPKNRGQINYIREYELQFNYESKQDVNINKYHQIVHEEEQTQVMKQGPIKPFSVNQSYEKSTDPQPVFTANYNNTHKINHLYKCYKKVYSFMLELLFTSISHLHSSPAQRKQSRAKQYIQQLKIKCQEIYNDYKFYYRNQNSSKHKCRCKTKDGCEYEYESDCFDYHQRLESLAQFVMKTSNACEDVRRFWKKRKNQ